MAAVLARLAGVLHSPSMGPLFAFVEPQRRGGEAAVAREFGDREHPCIELHFNGDDANMAFDEPVAPDGRASRGEARLPFR
jgi:hypothetical protein